MAITVKVNGVDISAQVKPFNTLKTGRTFSCQVIEVSPFTLTFEKEQKWLVDDGGTVVGGGRLKSINKSDFNTTGIRKWTLRGTDMDSEAKASICDVGALRTASESDAARIAWLFSTFDTRAITVSTKVLTVLASLPPQDFTGMSLAEALDAICKLTGAQWYIEPLASGGAELHYFLTETNNAPFNINVQSPNNTTTFPCQNFEMDEDTVEYFTDVYIIGDGVTGWRKLEDYSLPVPFTPRREASIKDNSIKDAAALDAAGKSFLLEHGKQQVQGSFDCFRAGLRSNQNIQITNSDYGLAAATFQIQSCEPQYRNDGTARYKVQFGTIPPPSIQGILAEQAETDSALETAVQEVAASAPDVSLLTSGGANMVKNSSFESAPGTEWTVGTGWTLQYASTSPFWGGLVARCVRSGTASGSLITDYIAVDRTLDYWFSFWSFLIARTGGNAQAYVREYSAANALLASTLLADITAVQTKWTRHKLHFGPTSDTTGRLAFNASTVKIKLDFIFSGSANGTWEIDGVQAEQGVLITAYAPQPQELVDAQITATQIHDDAITTPKLIANAVTAGKIAASAITADKIAAGAVQIGHFADASNLQICPNQGFENIDGVTVGAVSQPIPGWASQSYARIVNSPVDTGTYSLELAGNGANRDLQSAFVPAIAGKTVRWSTRVRGNAGNNAASAVGLQISYYDGTKTLISSSTLQTLVVGAGTSFVDMVHPDQVLPAGCAYVRFTLRCTSATPSGSEVYFDSMECFYLDLDISNSGGDVKIDSTGVVIRNGKLTFVDPYGTNVVDGNVFGEPWLRYIDDKIYNGDFGMNAPSASAEWNDTTNPKPYWHYVRVAGSRIIGQDQGSPATAALVATAGTGTAGDEVYVEQIARLHVDNANSDETITYQIWASFNASALAAGMQAYLDVQPLLADKVTTVGSAITRTQTGPPALGPNAFLVANVDTGAYPLARYARIRLGLKRGSAGLTATGSITPARLWVEHASLGGTLPFAVSLIRSALQSFANNTQVALSFDGGGFGANSGKQAAVWASGSPTRFTVPAGMAGLWDFNGHIAFSASCSGFVGIRLNGGSYIAIQNHDRYGTISVKSYLAAGDYVELAGIQTSGAALNANGYLAGEYRGPITGT